MNYKNEFYNKLSNDKIKINWNKNPIKMSLFISFLIIPYERSRDHLGSHNGWTKIFNNEYKLEVGGGIVKGIEYLDTIQYGIKLSNPYSNFVNPFFLFDILTKEGQLFFINYYKEDIDKLIDDRKDNIAFHESKLKEANDLYTGIMNEVKQLNVNCQ